MEKLGRFQSVRFFEVDGSWETVSGAFKPIEMAIYNGLWVSRN